MYESYWRLERAAFENDLDPAFYYAGKSHHGALLKLRYLLESRKQLGVLVGEHGLGKTYLTCVLEAELGASHAPFVRVCVPLLSGPELLRYLAARLLVDVRDGDRMAGNDQVLSRLEERLRELSDAGHRPVLVVDEAHYLEGEQLQTLQLMLNVGRQYGGLTIILCGRPELLPRIGQFPGLADRVEVKTALHPFSADETAGYIAHRLQVAGASRSMLDDPGFEAMHARSRGIPRKLNQLCDLALLVGFADGLQRVSRAEVEAASEELCGVSVD